MLPQQMNPFYLVLLKYSTSKFVMTAYSFLKMQEILAYKE